MSHCNGCSRFGGKRFSLKSRNLRATLLQKSYAYLRGCYGLKSWAYFVKGLHFESSQVKTRKGWSFASWNSSNLARINSQSIDSILLLFWSSSKSDINWKAAHMLVSAVASWLINLLFIWKRKEDTFIARSVDPSMLIIGGRAFSSLALAACPGTQMRIGCRSV